LLDELIAETYHAIVGGGAENADGSACRAKGDAHDRPTMAYEVSRQ
jgi:hypothetical protein